MNNTDIKIAVGIPTINCASLLANNLQDLATNMADLDHLIIVDNGNQSFAIPRGLVGKTSVHRPNSNLGVSGSWNFMMRKSFLELGCDYLLLLNDDIVLGKTKQQVLTVANKNPTAELIVGGFFWSTILLRKSIIDSVGYFDENFFPAYYEDNDYHYRCSLAKVHAPTGVDGLTPVVRINSATIKKNPSLNSGFGANGIYYKKKWGGYPCKEQFTTPFNGQANILPSNQQFNLTPNK